MTPSLREQKDAAFRRNEAVGRLYVKVARDAAIARADLARILMLEVAEEHPEIKAFSWEISWEYDDEGGYYACANINAYGELESYEVWDDLIEAQQYLDEESVQHLGPQEQEVTIEELARMAL